VRDMSVIHGIRYICLVCGNEETIRCSKEDYKEVHVCSNCSGALVDKWTINKYKKSNLSGSEEIKLVNPSEETKCLLNKKILTINEVRNAYGLNPIPNGNVIYQGY
jgi:hypothetical protein